MHGQELLLASNLYISEGLDHSLIRDLESMASSGQVCLLHTFIDSRYHRTGFTLASYDPHHLSMALIKISLAAIERIDLRKHEALHPRLGVVDHISIHPLISPLGDISKGLKAASDCGQDVGKGLSSACPIYFYGLAHKEARRLAEIRRSLGYFKPNVSSPLGDQWIGSESICSSLVHYPPDLGPSEADGRTGLVTIGAVPLILNYNVPISGCDMSEARLIARSVGERGGGLKAVESMALHHSGKREVIEIACNLLDSDVSPDAAVQSMVQLLVDRVNAGKDITSQINVGQGYLTGKSREELTRLALEKLPFKKVDL